MPIWWWNTIFYIRRRKGKKPFKSWEELKEAMRLDFRVKYLVVQKKIDKRLNKNKEREKRKMVKIGSEGQTSKPHGKNVIVEVIEPIGGELESIGSPREIKEKGKWLTMNNQRGIKGFNMNMMKRESAIMMLILLWLRKVR